MKVYIKKNKKEHHHMEIKMIINHNNHIKHIILLN